VCALVNIGGLILIKEAVFYNFDVPYFACRLHRPLSSLRRGESLESPGTITLK